MGQIDFIPFSSSTDTLSVYKQYMAWSECQSSINHQDTWPQTLTFRPPEYTPPPYKIMTNIFRGNRFKIGRSKK